MIGKAMKPARRGWWPPSPRVLYGLKAVTVAVSASASVLMIIPAAAWQRQVSELMGIEGPSTLGYLRTLLIAVVVGGALVGVSRVLLDTIKALARYLIRRWHVNDEVALFIGTAIVVVLIVTLVNGVLIRGFVGGSSAMFRPQERQHPAGDRAADTARKIRQPKLFRGVGHPRLSRPQLRGHRPARRRAGRTQRAPRQGTDPDLRRTGDGRHRRRAGECDPVGTAAHHRVRPRAAGGGADHRHRLGRSDRGACDRVDVQRRHRDRGTAVLVSAQLDFVPGGQADVDGLR